MRAETPVGSAFDRGGQSPIRSMEEGDEGQHGRSRLMDTLQNRRETPSGVSTGGGGGRVLIVSNRLPVTAMVEGSTIRLRPSSGGVAKGLAHVARHWPAVWFGWDGLCADEALGVREPARAGTPTVKLSLCQEEVQGFYHRFCNSVLWPVLHGWTDQPPPEPEDWQAYRAVNRRYAELVLRHVRPGDRIWIHDYHLFLLPALIRERNRSVPIAFFLHTPFPDAATLRHVPQHAELLRGLLRADLVGFHTSGYAANFLRAVRT